MDIGIDPQPIIPTPPPKKTWLIPALMGLVLLSFSLTGYLAYQNLQLRQPAATPTPVSPSLTPTKPTSEWDTYSNKEYTFQYPKGLKSDTGAAGQGFESIRVQYMGDKQIASGRTQTSLFDGYSFVVTKISSNTSKSALLQAQQEMANSKENCNSDKSTVSPITPKQIAGFRASQYTVTECFGNHTSSYLVNNGNLYRITQLYVGDEPEIQNYKEITDRILSSLTFISQTPPPSTSTAYSNPTAGFTINYPADWRKVVTQNVIGFGPVEIGEDVVWNVSYYDKSAKTIAQIKDDVGKQFPDRKQTEESINFGGVTAIKLVTTTNQYADWYSVLIIIDNGNTLYTISNGAQTDTALNSVITQRTGRPSNLKFENFYTSFRLLK